MMISSEAAATVKEKSKFPSFVFRKHVESNSILCLFCRCSLHKRYSGVRGKLEEGKMFKCQTCKNKQTDVTKDFPE